jgi:tRNA G10  N-methylase Trm11
MENVNTNQNKLAITEGQYVVVLGREIELCFNEFLATMKRFCFDFDNYTLSDNLLFFNSKNSVSEIASLMPLLGGTTKIYELLFDTSYDKFQKDTFVYVRDIAYLDRKNKESSRIDFGISSYDRKISTLKTNQTGFSIKKDLKKSDISARYNELKNELEVPTIISSGQLMKGNSLELGFFWQPRGVVVVGKMIASTNPRGWAERDFEKPAGDKVSGMLPPKLARIMLNLAIAAGSPHSESFLKAKTLVLDPFCGSGNMLMEAYELGLDFFGSDLSPRAVQDSIDNIEWQAVRSKSDIKPTFEIVEADATTADFAIIIGNSKLKIDDYDQILIVAEPYLGEPKKYTPNSNAVRGEYRKVKDIYLKFLENIAKLKKIKPVICLVFPLVETTDKGQFSLYKDSVDEIGKIGYTLLQSPLIYGRDYQVVKREIVLLSFNS